MEVLYESLQSDFTELCDQYGTVISSILDWEASTWDVHEKIPMASRHLVYNNEMGRRKQFVYFTSDYQSCHQRLVVKTQFLKQRMIISPI